MAEEHIILLPKQNYFDWVKAIRDYVLNFHVNITPDPVRAGSKDHITVVVPPHGYPSEGDIVKWLSARFAETVLHPVYVLNQEQLTAKLKELIDLGVPYRTETSESTSSTSSPLPFRLFWPTDYPVITQGFGDNPEIYGAFGLPGHEGLDIRAPYNTNVYAGADGEVFLIENEPNVHPYGKHIRIQHSDGFRTVYGHLAEILVSIGQTVRAKELIARANSTGNSSGSHLHLTLKKAGATSAGETQYRGDIIDPTPFLIYPGQEDEFYASVTYPWSRPCLVGVNAREDGTFLESDFNVIQSAKVESVKIQENTSGHTINRLRQIKPDMFIMARLAYDLGQNQVKPANWANQIKPHLQRLYDLGIRYYEIHQSPNLQMYGWNYSWVSGVDFGRWWMDIVNLLKDDFPEAKLGFPGVSPGGQVEGQRLDVYTFLEQADEAINSADWVGVNCYWNAQMEMGIQSKGAFYNFIRDRYLDKLIFVTEFANLNELTNSYVKGNEYVTYYQTLRNKPGFGGAFSQIISTPNKYGNIRWRNEDNTLTNIPVQVGDRKFR